MKTTTTILLFALMATLASAQSDTVTIHRKQNRNVKLEIHAGYTMPFGKYAIVDKDNKQAGYAADGFFIQVSGSWLGKRGLGLAASYCYQNNGIQASGQNDTLVDKTPVGSKHWNNHYILAGPVFQKEVGHWLLTVKVQGGGVLAFSPVFRISMPSTDTLNPLAATLSDGPGFGVAIQTQAGVGYRITDNLTIHLAFSFLGGNPNRSKSYSQYIMEKDPETGDEHLVFIQGKREQKRKISTFNVGAGIVLKL